MSFVKENGGPLIIGAVFFGIIAGYIELRIPPIVDKKLQTVGLVAPAKIEAMDENIEENEEDIDDLTDRWNRLVDAIAEK